MGMEQLFNQDFSSIQAPPTTHQQFAINEPYTMSPLTLSTITTTASFDPTPPSNAEEATLVADVPKRLNPSLIELSEVFTIVTFAPSQCNESTRLLESMDEGGMLEKHQESTGLERRTCTEEELDGMFPEDQSAISPEKDQTAPQPVRGPTLADPHTAPLVTHPEAMNTGDGKSASWNVTAAKHENHLAMVEHDVAPNFDVAGEHRPNDANTAASSSTAKKSISTKTSGSRRSQPITIDSDDDCMGPDNYGEHTQLVVSGNQQHAPPSPNRIKRTRAERPAGLVRWADHDFEESLRRNASDRFEEIQAIWMQMRDLLQLAGMSTVERFNLTIIEIATMENQAVSQEDTVVLLDLFEQLKTETLLTMVTEGDCKLVQQLGSYIRSLHGETFMTDIVKDYPSNDDDQDRDYRPAKRRRSS
jgi:hypothetical protein